MGQTNNSKQTQLKRLACKLKPLFVFAIVTLFIQTGLFHIFANVWENSRTQSDSKQPVLLQSPNIRGQVKVSTLSHSLASNLTDWAHTYADTAVDNFQAKTKPFNLSYIANHVGCESYSKDALSAINRAETYNCKLEIANFSCMVQRGNYYPHRLPNYCSIYKKNESSQQHYVGCFQDYSDSRLLPNAVYSLKANNTPERCIDLCIQSGYLYAGVQYRMECWCGRNEPDSSFKLNEKYCSMACPGDPTMKCGSYFKMNIYKTGLKAVISPFKTDYKKARIVFLLTLNGRADRQIKRLIKNLYRQDHYFFLHVDSRQKYLYNELLKLEKYSNIKLSRWRSATIWGGASLLQMLLHCMGELLEMDWKWDYVINLSESDFPIKNVDDLTEFLSNHMENNFLKSHSRDSQKFIHKQGLDRNFYECDNHMWRIGNRQLPLGIWIDGGSDWICLHRKFVDYVIRKPDDLVLGLLKVYQHALLPAESFFHSVIRNSYFCNTFVDNNLHLTNWKRKLGCYCQHKHVVDWCGCSPNNFLDHDFSRIMATKEKPLFFARKFEANVDQTIVNKVECWISGTTCEASLNSRSFWLNLFHHNDSSITHFDYSIYSAWANLTNLKLLMKYPQFEWNVIDLKTITMYLYDNTVNGILSHYQISQNNNICDLEVKMKYKSYFTHGPLVTNFSHQLENVYATSNWDQKEMLSRNYLNIINTATKSIFIVHHWSKSINNTFQIALIDPNNLVIGIFNYTSVIENKIHFLKVNLSSSLSPGIWSIKLMNNQYIIGENKFLVIPDVSYALENKQPSLYFNGSLSWYMYWVSSFKNYEDNIGESRVNTQEFLQSIQLIRHFYEVEDLCWGRTPTEPSEINLCQNTAWSSFSHDEKIEIT